MAPILTRRIRPPAPLAGQIADGRRDCFTGVFPSNKPAMKGRMVAYEGILVRELMALFEEDDDVVSYEERPRPIAWEDDYDRHVCKVQVAKTLASGRTVALLVHTEATVKAMGLRRHLPFIQDWAGRADYADVEIWTEKEIRVGNRVATAMLLASERTHVEDPAELHEARVAIHEMGGRASVLALRARLASRGIRSFRPIVRLVAKGELRLVDPDALIDDRAIVEMAG